MSVCRRATGSLAGQPSMNCRRAASGPPADNMQENRETRPARTITRSILPQRKEPQIGKYRWARGVGWIASLDLPGRTFKSRTRREAVTSRSPERRPLKVNERLANHPGPGFGSRTRASHGRVGRRIAIEAVSPRAVGHARGQVGELHAQILAAEIFVQPLHQTMIRNGIVRGVIDV